MNENERSASALRLTAAYRGLNNLQQALKMNEEEKVSTCVAAKVCKVTVGTLQHAKKAKAERRDIGVNGRPTLLSSKEELDLVKLIEEAEARQEHLTLEEVQLKVCVLIFYFYQFKNYISLTPFSFRHRTCGRLFLIKTSLKVYLHSLPDTLIGCLSIMISKKKLEFLLSRY